MELPDVELVQKRHPSFIDVEIQLFPQRQQLLVLVGDEGRVVPTAGFR